LFPVATGAERTEEVGGNEVSIVRATGRPRRSARNIIISSNSALPRSGCVVHAAPALCAASGEMPRGAHGTSLGSRVIGNQYA
jgi:hypothetical protein